jgi:hypothetical protein
MALRMCNILNSYKSNITDNVFKIKFKDKINFVITIENKNVKIFFLIVI